jgi:hypothetical protein
LQRLQLRNQADSKSPECQCSEGRTRTGKCQKTLNAAFSKLRGLSAFRPTCKAPLHLAFSERAPQLRSESMSRPLLMLGLTIGQKSVTSLPRTLGQHNSISRRGAYHVLKSRVGSLGRATRGWTTRKYQRLTTTSLSFQRSNASGCDFADIVDSLTLGTGAEEQFLPSF